MTMPPPPPPAGPGGYPPPPPPQPGGAPTVVPGVPPAPESRRRRRWPIWVAALVVVALVAGAAVAWAMLGDDGDSSVGGTADPEPMVTGDLDDNGYGDLLLVQSREGNTPTRVWTMESDGEVLADPVDSEIGNGQWLDLADVDGDGLADQVWTPITGDDDTSVVVSVVPADGDPWTAEIPIDPALLGDGYEVETGDVSGDGRSDLVLTNGFVGQGILGVHVAVAEEGGFGDLEQWYSGQTDAPLWGAEIGDGNGDGIADVFALTTFERKGDEGNYDNELQLLTSDGSELTAAADPLPVWGLGLQRRLLGVGDVDGDGADDPLIANPTGIFTVDVTGAGDPVTRQVYEHDLPEAQWRSSLRDYVYSNDFWGVTDADGDGTDDVVHLRPEGDDGAAVDVLRGTSEGLEPPAKWGFFPCSEDTCGDSYAVASPAR